MGNYNNNSYDFNYDMQVVIKDSETGQEIVSFKARENAPNVNNAGFEAGGVASGGHSYSIATNANVRGLIKSYKHQAFIDGVEYKVLDVGVSRSALPIQLTARKKIETVIYLG